MNFKYIYSSKIIWIFKMYFFIKIVPHVRVHHLPYQHDLRVHDGAGALVVRSQQRTPPREASLALSGRCAAGATADTPALQAR
jgi:hypothetical protein